jgi:hypothetical protein
VTLFERDKSIKSSADFAGSAFIEVSAIDLTPGIAETIQAESLPGNGSE